MNDKAALSIHTRKGTVNGEVSFSDRRVGNSCVSLAEFARPAITAVVPNTINICASEVAITAQGKNLRAATEARFGGIKAASVEELPPNDGTLNRIRVDLASARKSLVGLSKATVEWRSNRGLASFDVTLAGDGTKCDE